MTITFGVILHEMLSGKRTFTGESAVEVMNAILKDEAPELSETNAKVSPQLDRIVRRCLEKKPERRFQSASDLGFALEAVPWSQQTPQPLPAEGMPDNFIVTSWSADGQHLIGFHKGLVTFSFATQRYERLTDYGTLPVWLNDARSALFVLIPNCCCLTRKRGRPKNCSPSHPASWKASPSAKTTASSA
jgi:serine/threonine protein kinase